MSLFGNDRWINVSDAADYLGVKPGTVLYWISGKRGIPAHKVGKQWKFKCSELDAWVLSGRSTLRQDTGSTKKSSR